MTTASEYVEAARTYLGVRWHHLGRSKVGGVDCVGLLMCAAQDCGLQHDPVAPYPRGQKGFGMFDAMSALGTQVPLTEARDGDILIFADGLYPGHLGIRSTKMGLPYVIHAHARRHKVCEEPISFELQDSLRRAYRPAALE